MGLILVLGSVHHVDSPPLESNNNPVVDPGTLTNASRNGEQILPAMYCEGAPVPRSLGPTSGEPHCGPSSINQSSRVPEATTQMLSQNSSGTSRALNTPSTVPSGQGASAPDMSTPSESSRLQIGSPAHTRNEGMNQNTGETLLEEVVPERGPTTGRIQIFLAGENFPVVPLYVRFGENWARTVSYSWYHYPF